MSARKSSTPKKTPKKQRRGKRKAQGRRNWDNIIERLIVSGGIRRIRMGSSLSAQVTRCRLLKNYYGIKVKTTGDLIVIEV